MSENQSQDERAKEQVREALLAGNLPRAAELLERMQNRPQASPIQARINLLLSLLTLTLLAWFAIPLTATAWSWWY
jgi:hypothetical protein